MYNSKRRLGSFFLFTIVILNLITLVGCGTSPADLKAVDYTPQPTPSTLLNPKLILCQSPELTSFLARPNLNNKGISGVNIFPTARDL